STPCSLLLPFSPPRRSSDLSGPGVSRQRTVVTPPPKFITKLGETATGCSMSPVGSLYARPVIGSTQRILRWLSLRASPTREWGRSEEHTSELQSRGHLVCRL